LIDLTNPTLGTAYIENGYNTYFSGSTYYYNGTIKIATTWSDALSGIAAGTYPCNYTTDNGATNPWPSGLYNATHCYSPPITPTTDIIINFNISDNASNNAVGTARTYVRDNTAPTCSITSIKVNNSYGYNNSATSTIYYNNASVGSWNITVAISDAGSGVKNVTFPLLATISGSGGDLSYPHRSDDINAYKWNLTSTFNTTANFTCYDNLTNANIVTYTVRRDISPPSYGAINYTNGTYYTLSVLVNLSNGTDGANGAGVNASKARILRRNVTITADACGSWENVWYAINSSAPTSPFNDTTIANGKCYQYRYEVWDYIHNGVNFTSENIVKANGNNPPTTPTLYLPTKGNRTYHDRRPTFTWNSTDPDFNLINYTINISFSSAIACGPDISISLNVSNYTPTYDFCVDSIINWTVRAYDGTSYSSWSEMWNFTIESFISLNLTTAAIDFGTMAPGENRHTDAGGGGYSPLILENTGNVMINITKISANSSPWMTQPLNTVYIRFKADNITSEPRSFNYTGSAVNWTNLTAIDILNQTIIQNLDYNDSKDSAEIDLNITVPLDEIPGTRRFTIYLIGEQA